MKPALLSAKVFHEIYCSRSGYDIALTYQREREWMEWQTFRGRDLLFTERDLIRVISYLRTEISAGKRNEGALKFSNLVANPDRFEEDLQMALQSAEKPSATSPKPLSKSGRALMQSIPDEERPSLDDFAKFKREAGL